MTNEEAIRILDPETTGEALAEIEDYNGFSGKTAAVQAVSDACVLAVAALREKEERRWIPVSERLPENGQKVVFFNYGYDAVYAGKFNYVGKKGTVWFRAGKTSYPGSYWMPIPEPPKEDA